MLREHLLSFAMKALSSAYETKERIKNNLKSEAWQNYMRSVKNTAAFVVEHQWQKFIQADRSRDPARKGFENGSHHKKDSLSNKTAVKKERKSSIKPAKDIGSVKADIILQMLKNDASRLVKKNDELDGKKSLAYLVWALGHAERANLSDGISVHDVSALLYRACKIELYPINISRVVYGNAALVRQVGQEKRTKTYLLTPVGEEMFKEKFR